MIPTRPAVSLPIIMLHGRSTSRTQAARPNIDINININIDDVPSNYD
jgi:hypothetical protein